MCRNFEPDFRMKSNLIIYTMKQLLLLSLIFCAATLLGCQKDDARTYRFEKTMNVDGLTRYYLLNLPPSYNDSSVFPLVIVLHGGGGFAKQCERDYHLTEKANAEGYAIVYPEGVRSDGILGVRTWNAGTCCDFAVENNIDDVHFISELIDQLIRDYKIDSRRVYVTGISNGAMLSYKLACEIPEKIAAIAPVSGPLLTTKPCKPSRPVPILHIHSQLDTKVPATGGIGIAGYYYPPVDSGLNLWATINACNPSEPLVEQFAGYKRTHWPGCKNGADIDYYLTEDGGHSWPGGSKSRERADDPSTVMDANNLIWTFFKQHHLENPLD